MKPWPRRSARPTAGASGDAPFDDERGEIGDSDLSTNTLQPMRSVLLGEATSSVPIRHADSPSRHTASPVELRRPEASGPAELGASDSVPAGPIPEPGTEWRRPDPDRGGAVRRPISHWFSWLPQKQVLAIAAAVIVVIAIVVSSLSHVGKSQHTSTEHRVSPQQSKTTVEPGNFGNAAPELLGSDQPSPAPSSAPAQPSAAQSNPAQSNPAHQGGGGSPQPPPAPRTVALYSLKATVHAAGPSGQHVGVVLGSTNFADSTSMFVGCSGTPATLTYRLDATGVRLTTIAGLAGNATPGDLVTRVTITGDGRTLSDVTVSIDRQVPITADLAGIRSLIISAQRVSGSCALDGQPYGALGNAQLLLKA
jgi:hypothetical protein